jgi:hypothetical protein
VRYTTGQFGHFTHDLIQILLGQLGQVV